jgi:hypothetical protein
VPDIFYEEIRKKMKRVMIALGLALTLLMGQSAPAFAAGGKKETKAKETAPRAVADWSAVRGVPAGEKIVLRMKDGSRYEGRFESATDTHVNIVRNGQSASFERERIRRVSQKGGTSRRNGALWGLAIGGGGGAIVGGGLSEAYDDGIAVIVVPVFAAIGAGIGAGIGAAFGKGKKDVTIYEAP